MAPGEPDYDVIIVGAGISGIDAAYHLQTQCPSKSYTIIEARDRIGGTWDLFKYPGIRSDSDLHTFGFPWNPWDEDRTIADASLILDYLDRSAAKFGIDKRIQYRCKASHANWSTKSSLWSLTTTLDGSEVVMTSRWVIFGTGYYDYYHPLPAKIPGLENFKGRVVHPQFWPTDLEYEGKDVVIVGSGATAVTLLPNVAKKASHVTMLQRTPTYIVSQSGHDRAGAWLRKILPKSWALKIIRLKFLILPYLFYRYCRAFPQASSKLVQSGAAKQLPATIPVDPHFKPPYGPWEQRLCVCPEGDFYKALQSGKGSVVTAHIKTVTEDAIELEGSQSPLKPDIIVTATGLKLQVLGGIDLSVDDLPVEMNEKHLWRGTLVQDVPNMGMLIGYTNASWTLGAEVSMTTIARVLKHADAQRRTHVIPTLSYPLEDRRLLDLKSTYITAAENELPKSGNRGPWKPKDDYMIDVWKAKYGSVKEGLRYF